MGHSRGKILNGRQKPREELGKNSHIWMKQNFKGRQLLPLGNPGYIRQHTSQITSE